MRDESDIRNEWNSGLFLYLYIVIFVLAFPFVRSRCFLWNFWVKIIVI